MQGVHTFLPCLDRVALNQFREITFVIPGLGDSSVQHTWALALCPFPGSSEAVFINHSELL